MSSAMWGRDSCDTVQRWRFPVKDLLACMTGVDDLDAYPPIARSVVE